MSGAENENAGGPRRAEYRMLVFSCVCHSDSGRLSLLNEGGFCAPYGERGTEVHHATHVSN
jgi:hypothetical protein